MIDPRPATLEGHGVRLEPLSMEHHDGIRTAAADGELWNLFFTFVPEPEGTADYIRMALEGQEAGHMLPWVVRDAATRAILGSTRYHDIVAEIDRVEIGYTWYSASRQRSHVNTACKLLLLEYAFDSLGCAVVGLRTDIHNLRSQRAIEALGAKEGRRSPPPLGAQGRDSEGRCDVLDPLARMAGRSTSSRDAPLASWRASDTRGRLVRLLVFGNSGSGKTTLAGRLAEEHGIPHLDLDTLVWEPEQIAVQRTPGDVFANLDRFLETRDSWVIEGCYGELIEHAASRCTRLIFLNPGVEALPRPQRTSTLGASQVRDAGGPGRDAGDALQAWVRDYYDRDGDWSYRAHRAIFDAHPGDKVEYGAGG